MVDGLRLPGGDKNVVGFASLEVLVGREMRIGRHHLHGFAGGFGSVVNTEAPAVGYGWGGHLRRGLPPGAPGPGGSTTRSGSSWPARAVFFYVLPGEPAPTGYLDGWHRDLHFDLGVVTAFL